MGRAWGRRKDSKLPILEDIVVGLDTPYLMAGKDLESGPGGAGFVQVIRRVCGHVYRSVFAVAVKHIAVKR